MARTLAFGVEHDGEGRGYDNQGLYRKRTWRGISSGSEGHSGCNDATATSIVDHDHEQADQTTTTSTADLSHKPDTTTTTTKQTENSTMV